MRWREWLGVGERRWKKAPDEEVQPAKTLWDWLQLLIVPAILVAVTFAWSATQTSSDNKREEQRIEADNEREDRRIAADRAAAEEARRDATLQAYLDQMSGLMLHERLLKSRLGDGVRAVARTVTLTALRRLDGERKAAVVRFLYEARLLQGETPLVSTEDADLAGANLEGANLAGADLEGVDLAGANLAGANLVGVDLGRANLRGATLGGAYLVLADLGSADLEGANLEGANLVRAYLVGANLEDAKGVDLDRFITALSPDLKKTFLDSQKAFLDSLSREELAKFNLSPEKLAKFRREANGP